jgi:hypothetical protein
MSADSTPKAGASSDLSQTIRHLSEQMQVPLERIQEIYAREVNRLTAEARLHQFVGVLALGRTRTLLRESRARSARS